MNRFTNSVLSNMKYYAMRLNTLMLNVKKIGWSYVSNILFIKNRRFGNNEVVGDVVMFLVVVIVFCFFSLKLREKTLKEASKTFHQRSNLGNHLQISLLSAK